MSVRNYDILSAITVVASVIIFSWVLA